MGDTGLSYSEEETLSHTVDGVLSVTPHPSLLTTFCC